MFAVRLKAMKIKTWLKPTLKHLLILLALLSVVVTFLNYSIVTYRMQSQQLLSQALKANETYAKSLAHTTSTFISAMKTQLAFSAKHVALKMDKPSVLQREVTRLYQQNTHFNSVVVIDQQSIIVALAPQSLQVQGLKVHSTEVQQKINKHAAAITDPFISPAGNYVLSVSQPIFTPAKKYLGYVAGTIFLQQNNILKQLLNPYVLAENTDVYVIDKHGTIIYHQDGTRIGELFGNAEVLTQVKTAKQGYIQTKNANNTPQLIGYASIEKTGWTVLTQSAKTSALQPLEGRFWQVLMNVLPITLASFVILWLLAGRISKPLTQLAQLVKTQSATTADIAAISAWYYEAAFLKRAVKNYQQKMAQTITTLSDQNQTDPLTGLKNRRGLTAYLNQLTAKKQVFSVITVDIDHFKKVNDTFGHDQGDKVLQQLAKELTVHVREGDCVCRCGGEEFLIIIPKQLGESALKLAERIRTGVACTSFDQVGRITVSLGVATWFDKTQDVEQVLKLADKAMYQAKQQGRNQSVLAPETTVNSSIKNV